MSLCSEKAGPEAMANKQFFSGRKLSDLNPYQFGIPGLDKVMANPMVSSMLHYSPASAIASEGMSLLDPRKTTWQKALTELTGAKIGTYDAEMSRLWALQKGLQEELSQNPMIGSGEYVYTKKQYKGQVPPDLEAKLKLMRGIAGRIRKIQKKREAAGK